MKILFATLFLTINAFAADLYGTVVSVADGDTITILTKERKHLKIRLLGIDAPEKSQAYGLHSKQALSDLVYMKDVVVVSQEQDRYKRYLGKVFIDGADANLEQVKAGMAWWYMQYQRSQTQEDQRLYREAEAKAKRTKVGLWVERNPSPPWTYRKSRK